MNLINKKILLVAGLCFAFVLSGCQDTQKAVAYNDQIVAIQNDIVVKFLGFTQEIQGMDSADAQSARQKVLIQVEEGIRKAERLRFDGDDKQFKMAFMQLLGFYKKVITKDYQELVALAYTQHKPADHADKINALVARFTKEEEKYDLKFAAAQKKFAQAYNFTTGQNKLQQEIDAANK